MLRKWNPEWNPAAYEKNILHLRMKTSSGRKWDSKTCVGETYMLHYRDHYTVQGDIIYYQMLRFF